MTVEGPPEEPGGKRPDTTPQSIPTLEKAGSHRIKSQLPDRPADSARYYVETNPDIIEDARKDKANIIGNRPQLFHLRPEGSAPEIAELLRNTPRFVAQGERSSLTGGATPGLQPPAGQVSEKWVALDMKLQNMILDIGENTVTVQPGVVLKDMQAALAAQGKYYPPFPTYEDATMGGIISCNAAGAATFKYGQTRPWVERLKVVLANGKVLDIKRGEHRAHPDGYFELENAAGEVTRIDVPTYKMPDVVKSSAGYYAKTGMDLIDLFIGSEGTLGVITEATLRIIPLPSIHWALVPCESDEQALEVTKHLVDMADEAKKKGVRPAIDTSAIEYVDEPSMRILREDAPTRSDRITPPEGAKVMLLMQIEKADSDTSEDLVQKLLTMLEQKGLSDELLNKTAFATPEDEPKEKEKIKYFKDMREAVPTGVNNRVRDNQRDIDSRISKKAGDMIVPFAKLGEMMRNYRDIFRKYDLECIIWGHFSDGNVHPNVISKSYEDARRADAALLECAQKVKELGGSPLAEHGVGRSPMKQEMLKLLYSEEEIDQMRRVKKVLDPEGKLAPGNIFSLEKHSGY